MLVILGFLHVLIKFRISLSESTKKACCDFDRECIESIDQFYENWHYNIVFTISSLITMNMVYPFIYLCLLNFFQQYFIVFSLEVLCFLSDLFPDIQWVLALS